MAHNDRIMACLLIISPARHKYITQLVIQTAEKQLAQNCLSRNILQYWEK